MTCRRSPVFIFGAVLEKSLPRYSEASLCRRGMVEARMAGAAMFKRACSSFPEVTGSSRRLARKLMSKSSQRAAALSVQYGGMSSQPGSRCCTVSLPCSLYPAFDTLQSAGVDLAEHATCWQRACRADSQ